MNSAIEHQLGKLGGDHFDGLVAEVHFIDGQALTPSSFGEFDATNPEWWKPIEYTGTYGTNGFYLPFTNEATKHAITANGDAQHSTAQSKIGGSSIAFDGTGDTLTSPHHNDFNLGETFTIEAWVMLDSLTNSSVIVGKGTHTTAAGEWLMMWNGSNGLRFRFMQSNSYIIDVKEGSSAGYSTGVWYHCAVVKTTSTVKLYMDGSEVASGSYASTTVNSDSTKELILGYSPTFAPYLDGNLDEVRISNSTRYTSGFTPSTTAFTEDDNTLLLIHSDTTNGSTTFTDSSGVEGALGNDQSGNANHWTTNNLATTDQMLDSPTNNFCTMNPLASGVETEPDSTAVWSTKEGNLESKWSGIASAKTYATMAPTDGKWYWEFYIKTQAETARGYVGLGEFEDITYNSDGQSGESNYHIAVGNYSRVQAYGNEFDNVYPTPAQHDVYSIAIDWSGTSGKFWFRINGGSWQGGGNPVTGATPTKSYAKTIANASMMPYHASSSGSSSNVSEIVFNFGQDSSFAGNKTVQSNTDDNGYGDFYYSPPTDYLALCTQNLDNPADGLYADGENQGLAIGLWTGNSGSQTSVSDWPFQADFFWTKVRSNVDAHILRDIVRDGSTTMDASLRSNTTIAEYTSNGTLTANSTGFSVSGHDGGEFNKNNYTYVTWGWKMGGTGSSNTDGSITSTVSANVAAGQSIVSYTGTGSNATVGHGLSSAPELVIVKRRDNAQDWAVFAQAVGNTKSLFLNLTDAPHTGSGWWNDTNPTSSVFSVGTYNHVNYAEGYIAYCFHSVDGYSKVGSYTGNGSSDGTFVYTGFRPAYVMVKSTDNPAGLQTHDWFIWDAERENSNPVLDHLIANTSEQENEPSNYAGSIDFLSNGFKQRYSRVGVNGSGGTYIYIAFAEYPFKYSNAR